MQGYLEDLAYIHDVGFSDYALQASPGLLAILRRNGVRRGLVVDLGCGGGRWARRLNQAGYDVLGIDQSAAMIRLARRRAPQSKFVVASLLSVDLPQCDAITSIGECLNYRFDERSGERALAGLFRRVHAALRPGGVFVFDVAGRARSPGRIPRRLWSQGGDWAILVETKGSENGRSLTRSMTCYRQVGKLYRRSEETHRLRLYQAPDLAAALEEIGFETTVLTHYGRFALPAGVAAVIARKPQPS